MRSSVRAGVALLLLAAAAILLLTTFNPRDLAPPESTSALPSPPSSASSPGSVASASASAPAPPSSASSAAASANAPVSPLCRDLLAHNERILGERRAPQGVSFTTTCYPDRDGKGAWALRLDAWKKATEEEDDERATGEYTVVRLGAAGQVVAAAHARSIESGLSYSDVSEPVRFDFDGDGIDELSVHQFDKEHEGASSTSGTLYAFRDGRVIERSDVPKGYEEMADVDGDGRPDLLYHPYESVRTHPGSGFDFDSEGPAMVAHSLRDGTFSTTDAVAQAFARKACPTPRGAPPDAGVSEVDPEICARLWGATEAEARAVLRTACPQGEKCDALCLSTNDPCVYFKDRSALLARTPPLRINP